MSYQPQSSDFKLFTGKLPAILGLSTKNGPALKEPAKESTKLPQNDGDPALKPPGKEPSKLGKEEGDPTLKPPGKEPSKLDKEEGDPALKPPGKEPSKLDKEEGDPALKPPGKELEIESGFKPETSDKNPIKVDLKLGADPLTGKPAVGESDWLTGKKPDGSKQLGLAGGGALGAGSGLGNLGELAAKGGSGATTVYEFGMGDRGPAYWLGAGSGFGGSSAAVTVYESGAGAGGPAGYGLSAGGGFGAGVGAGVGGSSGGGSAAGTGHGLGGSGAGSFGNSGHGLGASSGF